MYQISIRLGFSSAHNLREYKGKCEALHGHNWEVEVVLESRELNREGMVMDFKEAKKLLAGILAHLDHKYINQIPPFCELNPTSENIAKYIFEEMRARIESEKIRVSKVSVWETSNSKAVYYEE